MLLQCHAHDRYETKSTVFFWETEYNHTLVDNCILKKKLLKLMVPSLVINLNICQHESK